MSPEEEQELIKSANRNPQAFGKLYEAYHNHIFNYIIKRVMDFDLANDITSETFLKAYINFWKFRWHNVSILNWFYRIATNEISSYYRKGSYRNSSITELKKQMKVNPATTPDLQLEKEKAEEELKRHQDFIDVQARLKLLPLKYQEVISLRYFERKKIKEISEILGKKEGTIKSLISRGLKRSVNFFNTCNQSHL